MAELFTSASRTLRDEVVSELKNQNDFLRNSIKGHPESFLSGCRVKVIPYQDLGQSVIDHECEGIYVKFLEYKPLIILKYGEHVILRSVPLNYIVFIDETVSQLFD